MDESLSRAGEAVRAGELVVYPTETVYGLGANALDPAAVSRVFDAKRRDRSEPISMAVPDLEQARRYVSLNEREQEFCQRFLPGPVTVVAERRPSVPDVLTAGRERVGIRVPDHELALALLETVSPVTATSANVSGEASPRRVGTLDERIVERATVVLDGGETPGGGSTVVDVSTGEIHRRGALVDDVEAWLG